MQVLFGKGLVAGSYVNISAVGKHALKPIPLSDRALRDEPVGSSLAGVVHCQEAVHRSFPYRGRSYRGRERTRARLIVWP